MINYDEFSKIELKIAKILEAEKVEGSKKLTKLILDAGDKDENGASVKRQIIAGIGKFYEPENLVGKQIVIVANLEPKKLAGLESNGMLLATDDEDGISVLTPDKEVKPGSTVS
jgi:methionyl-tRNA synthetase